MIDPDTTPEAFRVQARALRALGPAGRLAMAVELSENLREVVRAGIRMRHPDYDEPTVTRAVILLTAGEDVYRRMFGGEPVQP